MSTTRYLAAALAACACIAPPAWGQSNDSAQAPFAKAQSAATLRAPEALATAIRLAPPAPESIARLKETNARARTKRLDIGVGRELPAGPESSSEALRWIAVPGGMVARWEVTSEGARAVRVALRAQRLAAGLELRFAGSERPAEVYGPFGTTDIAPAGATPRNAASGPAFWSPVLEGETALVEVFVPGADANAVALTVANVSHLFVSPADPRAEVIAKAAGLCEVNLICRSAGDATLASAGRSVARMTFTNENGGQSLCTGTLLNAADGSFTPYLLSAAHCFATQSSASSLTTHWFYDSTSCSDNSLGTAYVQRPGGATMLFANPSTDVLLLRLNATPPAEAVYAGWDAATVARGTRIAAIHHPEGDVKKVSVGAISGFDASPLAPGNFIRVQWDSVATGVTEGGSSGSAIFTDSGSGLRVRGGLLGGLSSCNATSPAELFDVYSRLDHAFPFFAQHLAPASAPALGANVVASPGFEGGGSWTQSPASILANDASTARSGSWYARLGGTNNASDTLHQVLAIPPGPARLQFWYRIASDETTATTQFDRLTISIGNADTGASLATIGTLSNLDETSGWVQSPVYDLSAFANQRVRLVFRVSSDGSDLTSFRIDDLTLNGSPAASITNHTALYYNAAESGWGINVNHQGDTAFATLFTYTAAGAPMWLVMPAGRRQAGAATFMGEAYRTTGPPFNANPFTPIGSGNITEVGTMTLDFSAAGALSYTFNDTYVSKSVDKQVFGATAASCQGTTASRAGAANYQDLWWNAAESGWGLNLTHQGNTLFGTLFTYAANGQGLWLVLPAGVRQQDGSFLGELYRTSGPAFNAQPWPGIGFAQVGTMRVRFSNGETGSLEYSIDGVSVTKAITRQVFGSPAPLCNG